MMDTPAPVLGRPQRKQPVGRVPGSLMRTRDSAQELEKRISGGAGAPVL